MPKLNNKSSEKYGYNNMRGERVRNVGTPRNSTDALTWALPIYTTSERDALTPIKGMIIYNETTNKLNFYTTSWIEITST